MARFYADIAKRYDKLFDKDTYQLNRAAEVNVDGGKVNWSVKTKLDANNKVDSKLTVKHDCGRETLQLETSVLKNPKFILTTNRLPFFNGKFSVEEPKIEAEFTKKQDKVAFTVKDVHDWKTHGWETEASVSYEGFEKVAIGAKVSFDKPSHDKNFGIKDYNFKLEWQRNANQTFVVNSEKRFSEISIGGYTSIREGCIGFGKVKINHMDRQNHNWQVGVEQSIGNSSTVTATLRDGGSSSVLFKGKINNFEGHLVYNRNQNKPAPEKHSLEYKVVLNC